MEAAASETVTKFNRFTDEIRRNSCCDLTFVGHFQSHRDDAYGNLCGFFWPSGSEQSRWRDLSQPTTWLDRTTKELRREKRDRIIVGEIRYLSVDQMIVKCEIIYGSAHTWRDLITFWRLCFFWVFLVTMSSTFISRACDRQLPHSTRKWNLCSLTKLQTRIEFPCSA